MIYFLKKNSIYYNFICINLTSIFLIDLKILKDIMSLNLELIIKFNLHSESNLYLASIFKTNSIPSFEVKRDT